MLISLPLLWESIAEANFILQDLLEIFIKRKKLSPYSSTSQNQEKIDEPQTI